MAQIIPIVSDALQATIRRLLPSQNGFGEDLQASNVIVPVVNVTPSAEGSILGTNLQTALAFGSQTSFSIKDETETIADSPGFYRIFGTMSGNGDTSQTLQGTFDLRNGLSVKNIYGPRLTNGATAGTFVISYDFVVFLSSGESITGTSLSNLINIKGSSRQIATVSGNVVNPSGFTGE